jgi:hypothetical protein
VWFVVGALLCGMGVRCGQQVQPQTIYSHIKNDYSGFIKGFYSSTDAKLNCLKNNFEIYVKIDIKTTPTCFGAITIIREYIFRALASSNNALPDDGDCTETCRSCFNVDFNVNFNFFFKQFTFASVDE